MGLKKKKADVNEHNGAAREQYARGGCYIALRRAAAPPPERNTTVRRGRGGDDARPSVACVRNVTRARARVVDGDIANRPVVAEGAPGLGVGGCVAAGPTGRDDGPAARKYEITGVVGRGGGWRRAGNGTKTHPSSGPAGN